MTTSDTATFVIRTDVHIADHNPASRLDDWSETVFRKLTEVGEIAREVEADAVLDNGDLFDIKSPAQNSHRLVHRLVEVHNGYPCDVYGNVGNHDCVYGNYEYLPQQPLGVLFASGNMKRLYDDHELVIEKAGFKVRVVGVPYHGTSYDLDRFRIERGDEDHLMVLAHVLASPAGGSMFENEDIIKYADLDKLAPGVDVWHFGHWHKDQGIQTTPGGATVINLGSLTRGALAFDDMDRKPAVAIVRFTQGECKVERRNITIEPANKVFDTAKRVAQESRAMTMSHFVESLQDSLRSTEDDASLEDKIRAMEVADEVREAATLFIEQARGGK